jgi:hypothetical protein
MRIPLSSIGLPLKDSPDLTIINSHPGLPQFHAERVIELADHHRATDPSVSQLISNIAGAHRELLIPQILHSSS